MLNFHVLDDILQAILSNYLLSTFEDIASYGHYYEDVMMIMMRMVFHTCIYMTHWPVAVTCIDHQGAEA